MGSPPRLLEVPVEDAYCIVCTACRNLLTRRVQLRPEVQAQSAVKFASLRPGRMDQPALIRVSAHNDDGSASASRSDSPRGTKHVQRNSESKIPPIPPVVVQVRVQTRACCLRSSHARLLCSHAARAIGKSAGA